MEELRELIGRVARSQAPVHISGESGTGKELVAQLIHESGPRRDGPFVPVNCGAIPTELMESELFGHKRGSFTGAVADKKGLVQVAEGGTLFLDEVADLPLHMQVKLLRLIQERTVRPVGEAREVPVDARILSATHRNLAALVAGGAFREDLYYRINVIEIKVPPLRARLEDVPDLARSILARLARRSKLAVPEIAADAMKVLVSYHYPGNVRELENILERALTLCAAGRITAADIAVRPGAARRRARWNRPTARSIPRSSTSSARRSSRRSSRRATTRPRPPGCSASPSGRCATGSRSWASSSGPGRACAGPACTSVATPADAARQFVTRQNATDLTIIHARPRRDQHIFVFYQEVMNVAGAVAQGLLTGEQGNGYRFLCLYLSHDS